MMDISPNLFHRIPASAAHFLKLRHSPSPGDTGSNSAPLTCMLTQYQQASQIHAEDIMQCRSRTRLANHAVMIFGILLAFAEIVSAQIIPDKRLIQKTSIAAASQPLEDVLKVLCDKHKLQLQVDESSLNEDGIDLGVPVTNLQADGITLDSALHLLLEPHGLTFLAEKGTLHVETYTKSSQQMMARNYSLAGLGQNPDLPMLTYVLQSSFHFEWEDIDGVGGTIAFSSPQSMTVLQNYHAHLEIADLLERMAAAMAGRQRPPTAVERSEGLLLKTLSRPVALPSQEIAIKDLPDFLRKQLKINTVVLETSLQDEGIDPEAKISISDSRQPAAKTISAALEDHDLTALIRHEVFYITTKTAADELLTARIYDSRLTQQDPEALAAKVIQTKELGPWEDVDGIGGKVSTYGPLVIIYQTAASHEQLAGQLGPGK